MKRKKLIKKNLPFQIKSSTDVSRFYVDNKQCLTHSTDAGTSIEQYWYKVVIRCI
jgi:hypothetical protein